MSLRIPALRMLAELYASHLEVVKRRSPRGGYVRVVTSVNCDWYRRFCAAYRSTRTRRNRAFDTMIRRQWTIAALRRIAAGATAGVYVERLLPFVEDYRAAAEQEERYLVSRPAIPRRYRSA